MTPYRGPLGGRTRHGKYGNIIYYRQMNDWERESMQLKFETTGNDRFVAKCGGKLGYCDRR